MSTTPDPEFGKALTQAMEDFANNPQPPAFDAPAMLGRARHRRRLLIGGTAAAVAVLGTGVAFGAQALQPAPTRVTQAASAVTSSPTAQPTTQPTPMVTHLVVTAPTGTPAATSTGLPVPWPTTAPTAPWTAPATAPVTAPWTAPATASPSPTTPPLTAPATPGPLAVPSVIGMPADQARQTLAAAGLQATLPAAASGRVISQIPAAGAHVPKGTTVELTLGNS
jgi:hypothetical protein